MGELNREEIRVLNEKARCAGEYKLFSNVGRTSFMAARKACDVCPVQRLCEEHVDPGNNYFTGTCAGKLWYEGVDVTEDPEAEPPPVFVEEEFSSTDVEYMLSDEDDGEWSLWSDSNQMAACWILLKSKTVAKAAKRSKLPKTRVSRLAQEFNEAAPAELKDFLLGLVAQ